MPSVLCALVIMVPRDIQGRGVSAAAVRAMGDIARRHGLQALIAPVRPSWKERYPLVPIERYARWRRPDGWLFDPWMRVHERIGAAGLKPEPRSLRITGTTTEWEDWTGMTFPESGDYWFPGGLATVHIDRERDHGSYWARPCVRAFCGVGCGVIRVTSLLGAGIMARWVPLSSGVDPAAYWCCGSGW